MDGPVKSGQEHDATPEGVILPLDVVTEPARRSWTPQAPSVTVADTQKYAPERQRDVVRLIVTCGLLCILGYLVVFATIESASYPSHWAQTKELLQILLPALTGIIGTVIGFYFGTVSAGQAKNSGDDGNT